MSTKGKNNGGETDYWALPSGAETLNDLIEYKEMSFALGSIFKAAYRFGDERHHSSRLRDLNKMRYYIDRMIAIEERKENV